MCGHKGTLLEGPSDDNWWGLEQLAPVSVAYRLNLSTKLWEREIPTDTESQIWFA